MNPSVREQIVQAIVAALSAPGTPAKTVDRFRQQPVAEDGDVGALLPALSVYTLNEPVERMDGDLDNPASGRTLRIAIEGRTAGHPPDQVADPLLSWATQQMTADRTWGGLAEDTREVNITWLGASAERNYARTLHEWDIDYHTVETDPTQPAP